MKVGREPSRDAHRTRIARQAIGEHTELFVDANGAFHFKNALGMAELFSEAGVSWFEEPVPSDDLTGLRLMRERGPAGMLIAAGEYGYEASYFRRMLESQAVDILQADATRCGGITEFLRVGALCEAFGIELSSHTAPALHLHPACALGRVTHMEYFADHVRIERLAFEGALEPVDGRLIPDLTRPGLGLEPRMQDLERWRVA
jgi:L-alanine-DL-glutamate epimerase-like enolase superfamily enzyme